MNIVFLGNTDKFSGRRSLEKKCRGPKVVCIRINLGKPKTFNSDFLLSWSASDYYEYKSKRSVEEKN